MKESEINTLKLEDPVTARGTCEKIEQMLKKVLYLVPDCKIVKNKIQRKGK